MKPVCLITGAGGRLGRALCTALQDRYHVVASYRSTPPLLDSQLQRSHRGSSIHHTTTGGGKGIYLVQADLTHRDDMQHLVEIAMARHGQIDVLINSAADIKFHGNLRDLWQAEDYPQSQLLMNSIVPVQLASAIYQYCWKDRLEENLQWNRSIVNVSSISGLYVYQERGQAFYGVSKAALNMLTLYQSLEYARYGVRVNAICPSQFKHASATQRVIDAIEVLLKGQDTGTIVTKVP